MPTILSVCSCTAGHVESRVTESTILAGSGPVGSRVSVTDPASDPVLVFARVLLLLLRERIRPFGISGILCTLYFHVVTSWLSINHSLLVNSTYSAALFIHVGGKQKLIELLSKLAKKILVISIISRVRQQTLFSLVPVKSHARMEQGCMVTQ